MRFFHRKAFVSRRFTVESETYYDLLVLAIKRLSTLHVALTLQKITFRKKL